MLRMDILRAGVARPADRTGLLEREHFMLNPMLYFLSRYWNCGAFAERARTWPTTAAVWDSATRRPSRMVLQWLSGPMALLTAVLVVVVTAGLREPAARSRLLHWPNRPGTSEMIVALGFSRDGATLYGVGGDGAVVSWNIAATRPWPTSVAPPGYLRGSGKKYDHLRKGLYAPARSGGLVPRHGERGLAAALLTGAITHVRYWAFSGDGGRLAVCDPRGDVVLWDTAAGRVLRRVAQAAEPVISRVALSGDGTLLAVGRSDGAITLFDADTGTVKAAAPRPSGIPSYSGGFGIIGLIFTTDGTVVASLDCLGEFVRLWDPGTGRARRVLRGRSRHLVSLASGPGGALATADDHGTVQVWDVATGTERQVFQGPPRKVTALAFSPDGRTLVTADTECVITLWNVGSP